MNNTLHTPGQIEQASKLLDVRASDHKPTLDTHPATTRTVDWLRAVDTLGGRNSGTEDGFQDMVLHELERGDQAPELSRWKAKCRRTDGIRREVRRRRHEADAGLERPNRLDELSPLELLVGAEAAEEKADLIRRLPGAVKRLPRSMPDAKTGGRADDLRLLIRLRLRGWTIRDLSDELGMSLAAIHRRLNLAHSLLRVDLTNEK